MKKVLPVILLIIIGLLISCKNNPESNSNTGLGEVVSVNVSNLQVGGSGMNVSIGADTQIELENLELSKVLVIEASDEKSLISKGANGRNENKYHQTNQHGMMPRPDNNGRCEGTGSEMGASIVQNFIISLLGCDEDFTISSNEYPGKIGYVEEFYDVNFALPSSEFYAGPGGNFDKSRVCVTADSGGTGYSIVAKQGFASSTAGGLHDFSNYNEFIIDYARYLPGEGYSEKIYVVNPYIY